ncbi:MAG TPA: hypothetical protein VHV28_08035 [Solirubrobacteraceae bacterium]|jgi:hypothetical protein|nr:hypothetical protein [Solirubrobacteraceae bacterium]
MFVLATIGSAALYLLFVWLLSAAGAAWLAERKGYGERVGLFFGLILSAVGFGIVLLLPARPGSVWKIEGPLPNPGARRPLGLASLGSSATEPDAAEALGPSLGDVSAPGEPAADESQGGDGPPPPA